MYTVRVMLSLSRKTDYALLILTALVARPGAFVSLKVLARERRLPLRFAAQVVRPLVQRGMLESREGASGGYRLARDPREITVRDVVEVEEGGVALAACLDERRGYACPQGTVCAARGGMPVVQRVVLQALKNHTIADLASATPAPRARTPGI